MSSSTTTRPVNLTTVDEQRARAAGWLACNGPLSPASRIAVGSAIEFSAAHGDPFLDNPFRRALLQLDAERTYPELAAG